MHIVMEMSKLSSIGNARVVNLLRIGNAYAILLYMNHET